MITEFGGHHPRHRPTARSGTATAADPTRGVPRGYRELVDALLDSPAVAGFCYTQLTDTVQEKNGLLTDRREPKVPAEQLRAINRRTAASVPADAIGAFEFGDYPAPLDRRIEQDPAPRARLSAGQAAWDSFAFFSALRFFRALAEDLLRLIGLQSSLGEHPDRAAAAARLGHAALLLRSLAHPGSVGHKLGSQT